MTLPVPNEPGESRTRRARWMLVDDDPAHLELMSKLLRYYADAEIEAHSDSEAAWHSYKSAPQSFDLVITDLAMPGTNGVQLCHRILGECPGAKVPLTTGHPDMRYAGAQREGFCGLLRKPYLVAALISAVELAGVPGVRIHPAASPWLQCSA